MLALISSDVLKLRRRRGMLAISLLLTAGLMAVAFVVMAIQHGGDPTKYGPAGGLGNYKEDIAVVTLMAMIVGTIIGATSGTQDIESAGCVALAGSLAAPGAGAILAGTAAVLVAGALSAAVAVGVSALVGSRGPVIGIMLAFYLAVQNLVLAMGFLGGARQVVPDVAIKRIGDLEPVVGLDVGLGAAALVVIGWSAIALGLGAWRTKTREI
jgi:hypothetical protein